MLSKPEAGWSRFQLEGTSRYWLSYLDDIPMEWLDQTIHGLETMLPFCVKGFMEPDYFLCTVSYWNCYILREWDGSNYLEEDDRRQEYSHTSMIAFCKALHTDISRDMEAWIAFYEDDDDPREYRKRKKLMQKKLDKLQKLIIEKETEFADGKTLFI